ncbi:hypothetical protein [Streptomyces sp. VMFN-G11Ma]|uniref:hypothetical protein n=1 Tax=Streptomyces sp. VMFN-G11Ma TaxID=2135609 RepID=UPI000D3D9480|nr:hypothetical protein [Streptomyces sp. VMFN-G11Ma]PTM94793.1 hypothetical protein C7821_106335 [Streptomyces sp. VMFN-G11Ma]
MSDSQDPRGRTDHTGRPDDPASPDFLDRLIARHTAPRPAAVRVRPRLPGPFERVEAVRSRSAAPEDDALLWPQATPAAPSADLPRTTAGEARTHTEREHTLVRTEHEPAGPDPRPAAPTRTAAPLLRPAAPVAPGPRPPADTARRAVGRGRAAQQEPAQSAVPVPNPPGAETAPHAVSAALRPSAADTAAARDAVRQAAARRPARTTEQVVQVQIGRLEVTAQPSGGGRRNTPAKERAGATVSLADYLARGRE